MIQETCTVSPWFKAILKEPLLKFKEQEKVWFKLNTESPLNYPTYWIFNPVDHRLAHVSQELGQDYLKGVREHRDGYAIATASEQKRLDHELQKILLPIVRQEIKDKRKFKDFQSDKLTQMHKHQNIVMQNQKQHGN